MDPSEPNSDLEYAEENDADEVIYLHDGEEAEDDDNYEMQVDEIDSETDEDEDEDDEGDDTAMKQDDAVIVYRQHTSEVYCVSIDQVTSQLAVTGGKDNRAFIWNINDGRTIFECTGHDESVVSVDFNHSGTLVATADMKGLVKVWKIKKGAMGDVTVEESAEKEFMEIQWLKWHQRGNVLMAGTGDNGDIVLWESSSQVERYLPGQGAGRCNVGNFLADGKRAVAGYDSGVVKVWALNNCTCIHTFRAHNAPVTAINCHPEKELIVSASVDNTASLLQPENGQILHRYNCQPSSGQMMNAGNSHDDDVDDEEDSGVFAVALSPSSQFKFLATGTKSGLLIIWDYASHIERVRCQHSAGIERLVWHSSGLFIYACTADGKIYVWDARNGSQKACWQGHRKGIFDMDLSRDGSCLVTVSYDRTARVYTASLDV